MKFESAGMHASSLDSRRDRLKRVVWLLSATYVGTITGLAWFTEWQIEASLFNPLTAFALLPMTLVTPGPNVMLFLVLLLSYLFVRFRVPIWTVVIVCISFAVLSHWVMRMWSVGTR